MKMPSTIGMDARVVPIAVNPPATQMMVRVLMYSTVPARGVGAPRALVDLEQIETIR